MQIREKWFSKRYISIGRLKKKNVQSLTSQSACDYRTMLWQNHQGKQRECNFSGETLTFQLALRTYYKDDNGLTGMAHNALVVRAICNESTSYRRRRLDGNRCSLSVRSVQVVYSKTSNRFPLIHSKWQKTAGYRRCSSPFRLPTSSSSYSQIWFELKTEIVFCKNGSHLAK